MSSSNVSWFSSQQTSQREEIDNMWFPVGGHALSDFLSTEIEFFPLWVPLWQQSLKYTINTNTGGIGKVSYGVLFDEMRRKKYIYIILKAASSIHHLMSLFCWRKTDTQDDDKYNKLDN